MIRFAGILAMALLAGCAPVHRCSVADMGGWMTGGEDTPYAIKHSCTPGTERFILRVVASRTPDGMRVAEWTELATLDVALGRGESTMYGTECGTEPTARGNVIAVVGRRRDDSFVVKRAWLIDPENRRFVGAAPDAVFCESLY